jgi:hypothetical protein
VAENAAPRSKDHSRLDLNVIANANLAANDGAIPDSATTGDSSLGGNHNIFADLDVVTDVHHVVDLRAPVNDCGIECSSIDRAIRANVDVIFDQQSPDLGKELVTPALVANVTESGRAHHRSRLQDYAVAQLGSGMYGDIRPNTTVLTDYHPCTNH